MRRSLRSLIEDRLPDAETLRRAAERARGADDDLPSDPVEWTRRCRVLKGEPWSFDRREYLYQPYRDEADEVYIAKGRQTEISEKLVNRLLCRATTIPHTVHLFVADRQSHTSKFSKLRVRDWALKPSPILNEVAPWKEHTAETLPLPNGSVVYFHSAWSDFEEARSVPADFTYLDEIQSVSVDEISVLLETLGHSKYGKLIGVGTGAPQDSPWHRLHSSGTRYEWDGERWRARGDPAARVHSYTIPQTIVPWVTEAQLAEKRSKYTPARYAMEVLGEFPRGAERPLTEQAVRACLDRSLSYEPAASVRARREQNRCGPVVMGIDWAEGGAASTVVHVAEMTDDAAPVMRVLDITRVDAPDVRTHAERAAALIDEYVPEYAVMDAGGNASAVQEIERRYATGVRKCVFMTRPSDPWKLDELTSRNLVKIDRSYAFEQYVDLVARPGAAGQARVILPYAEPERADWVVDQYVALEAKTTRLMSGEHHVTYGKAEARQYDALLAGIYALVAWRLRERGRGGAFYVGRWGG